MTVSSNDRIITYTGDASTTVFAYDFPITANTEITVIEKSTATPPVYTTKTLTTHYSVSITAAGTGNVTMVTAPASGVKLILIGATPLTQATDYVENDSFSASTHETALDKLTKIVQEHDTKLDKTVHVAEDVTTVTNYRMPPPTASNVIRWNSGATGLENVTLSGLGAIEDPVPVASGGTGSITAAAARTALGLAIGTDVQAYDAQLADVAGLTPTDGNIIVGDGANFVTESGATARTSLGAAASGANTDITSVVLDNTGLAVKDTAGDHNLTIKPGSDTTANRTLTLTTGDADRTITLSGNTTLSGTNTGDQTISLTGDVTGSGTGSFAATIANDAVTYAKIQNVSATDKVLGRSTAGAGDVEEITCTAAGRALLDDASASDQRTTLGLAIGTDVQAYDATLQSLSSLGTASDKYAYTTGVDTWAEGAITAAARTVLDDASVSAMVDTLGGASSTGSGGLVRTTSPSLVTPEIGAATGTSLSVSGSVTGQTGLVAGGNSTAAGTVQIFEDTDDGSNKVTITVPAIAADYTLTLPVDDGTSGQLLTTNGSGVLSWSNPGAAAAGGDNTEVQYNATGVLDGAPGFVFDGTGTATLSVALVVGGNSTAAGNVQFKEDSDNGANKITVTAPAAVASDKTVTWQDATGTVALIDVENQAITGGATVTSKDLGTASSGTLTLDMGDRPLQHYTNGGAHTLAPGTVVGSSLIDITNNGSAGAITTSGWTKVSGDSFTTTNGHKFRCHTSVGTTGSLLIVKAMQ